MGDTPIVFDGVWKKFCRGERHDSFRDLIPALAARLLRRRVGDALQADEFWALQDVSFAVARGEALGIIGANGAGKSTTLKLLTRILRATRGSCHVRGRAGALIEVTAGFHPDLTGRENVFLQGAIMGMRRQEITARFDEIVAFAGVEAFIDTPVKRYSSGMNARLGFSIAAHLHPDVLIIDEVLSVGDTAFQARCASRMKEYVRQGVAVVFVSHNLGAVTELCRRALLLEHGRAVAVGPAAETITTYCRALDGAGVDADEDVSIAVRPERQAPGTTWNVKAGDRLKMTVDVTFRHDVQSATVGVVVWDLVRNLYVYGASSDSIGIPMLQAAAGQTVTLAFEWAANLARGAYVVEVNVHDPVRQRRLGLLKPAAYLSVSENTTYDGIANLFLTGRVHRSAEEALSA